MCYPSREICFERPLIDIAGLDRFARDFKYDVLGFEEDFEVPDDAVDLLFPESVSVCLLKVSKSQFRSGFVLTKLYMLAAPTRNVPALYVH